MRVTSRPKVQGTVNMSSSSVVKHLREEDVPGASLTGRDPGTLKIPELKRWLQCRGASIRGKEADLVLR